MMKTGAPVRAYRMVAGATRSRRRISLLLAVFLVLALFLSLPAQPLTPVAQTRSLTSLSDSLRADSLARAKQGLARRVDTAKVVMHHFDHKQQIITGGSIMACLIGIMVVMNNYNPRVPL